MMTETTEKEKPQAHVSSMDMFWRCGEQYRRRFLDGDIIPPGVALIVGRATHKGIEVDLKHKAREGALPPMEMAVEAGIEATKNEFSQGVSLDESEAKNGLTKTRGAAEDSVTSLVKLYHEKKAPEVNPTGEEGVERKFLVEMKNYPFDLAGTIDVDEGDTIRDTKTRKASPPKDLADKSVQMTAYSLVKKVIDGKGPSKIAMDFLIKTKTPKLITLETTRGDEDFRVFLARFENFIKCVEAGVFPPAQADHWICSPKWCGYYRTCAYAAKRVVIGT